ncbi:MAG TPA: hypothetical protein VMU89_13745 [Thermomicrobiaceae bacterium]|nr:hypothetical protein [Thermomicrobiaceae bacterium]
MAGRGKRQRRPKVRYPLGRVQHDAKTTQRSYGYRVRQTKRGRVPASPDDLTAYLQSRAAKREAAAETPAS